MHISSKNLQKMISLKAYLYLMGANINLVKRCVDWVVVFLDWIVVCSVVGD